MSGPKVQLDLNYPAFQDDLLKLEANELKPVMKTLRKLRNLDWPSLYRDSGWNSEQIKEAPGRFTIRVSRPSRAVVRRDGNYIRFVALYTDHDSAYGKK